MGVGEEKDEEDPGAVGSRTMGCMNLQKQICLTSGVFKIKRVSEAIT